MNKATRILALTLMVLTPFVWAQGQGQGPGQGQGGAGQAAGQSAGGNTWAGAGMMSQEHIRAMEQNMSRMQEMNRQMHGSAGQGQQQRLELMERHMERMQEHMELMQGDMRGPRSGAAAQGQTARQRLTSEQRVQLMEQRMDQMQLMMEQMLEHQRQLQDSLR